MANVLTDEQMEKMRCNIPPNQEMQDAIQIIEVPEPGHVRFTVDVPESFGNYHGKIHGGTEYMIGEIGAGFATYSFGVDNVCNMASINFVRAVPCSKLEVETEALHKGRSTALIRVMAREASTGKLVFTSTHNMFLFGPFEDWE
jgi:acyl-coenzyme A thioesterase PaaI-like protein